MEYFRIPRDVLVVCVGKSTYARCGIIVNVTPLEPEWEGHVTLEFSNTTPLPAKIYANEGACQFLFFQGDEPCEVSYADRAGKYMGQTGGRCRASNRRRWWLHILLNLASKDLKHGRFASKGRRTLPPAQVQSGPMAEILVNGGNRLQGEIPVSGAKMLRCR